MAGQNFFDISVIHVFVYGTGISDRVVSGIDLRSQVVGLQPDELESAWPHLFCQQHFVWSWRRRPCLCGGAASSFALSQDSGKDQDMDNVDYFSHFYNRCGLQRVSATYGKGNYVSLGTVCAIPYLPYGCS